MQNFGSLFAAYMAVWAIFIIYDFSVARRMSRAERDIVLLKQKLPQG